LPDLRGSRDRGQMRPRSPLRFRDGDFASPGRCIESPCGPVVGEDGADVPGVRPPVSPRGARRPDARQPDRIAAMRSRIKFPVIDLPFLVECAYLIFLN